MIMKIKNGFELRDVCGENVIIAVGIETIDFSKVISANDSAAFIWKTFLGKDFSAEDITDAICKEYDIEREIASKDVDYILEKWTKVGLLD